MGIFSGVLKEGLCDHQNHDGNEQQSRDLIKKTVEGMGAFVLISLEAEEEFPAGVVEEQ